MRCLVQVDEGLIKRKVIIRGIRGPLHDKVWLRTGHSGYRKCRLQFIIVHSDGPKCPILNIMPDNEADLQSDTGIRKAEIRTFGGFLKYFSFFYTVLCYT